MPAIMLSKCTLRGNISLCLNMLCPFVPGPIVSKLRLGHKLAETREGFAKQFIVLLGLRKSKRYCVGLHSGKHCVQPSQDYLSYKVMLRAFPYLPRPISPSSITWNQCLVDIANQLGELISGFRGARLISHVTILTSAKPGVLWDFI